jgi:hypothetical protein
VKCKVFPDVLCYIHFQVKCHGSIFFKTSTVLDNKKDRSTPALPQAKEIKTKPLRAIVLKRLE